LRTRFTDLPAGWTFFPTIGYSFSEAQGDIISATNNFYVIDEFGFNPITNNLGNSLSLAQSGSLNVGGAGACRLLLQLRMEAARLSCCWAGLRA
jgi:hypothetical protein